MFHPMLLADPAAAGELRLPFEFRGVRLLAAGARRLRVRLTSIDADGCAVQAADGLGQPVFSMDSLRARPVPASALAASTGPVPHGVDWVEVSVPAGNGAGFAFLDPAHLPSLEPVPEFVVTTLTADDGNVPAALRELSGQALDLIQTWVSGDRFAGSRLVFRTRADDLAGAAVLGLVRSAQSEHPGRFVLLDAGPDFTAWGSVAAAVEAGESQLDRPRRRPAGPSAGPQDRRTRGQARRGHGAGHRRHRRSRQPGRPAAGGAARRTGSAARLQARPGRARRAGRSSPTWAVTAPG